MATSGSLSGSPAVPNVDQTPISSFKPACPDLVSVCVLKHAGPSVLLLGSDLMLPKGHFRINMNQDSLGPVLRPGQLPILVPRPWDAGKYELSPSLQWKREALVLPEDLISRPGLEYCACSWPGYPLITWFAFSFTGESWLARAPRCPGEARASGKFFFLIHPPCCSFRILRPAPLYLLMDHGWGAPTSKTSLCLPAVLG